MKTRNTTNSDAWIPDVQDPSLLTSEKGEFIYQSACTFLGESITLADDLNESARKSLVFFTGVLTAVVSFMLVKCDFAAGFCHEQPYLYRPGVILVTGYAIGALVLIWGCLWAKDFSFRGNEPKNLLTTSVCQYDLDRIKLAECINMQARISMNVRANRLVAKLLNATHIIAVIVPLAAFLAAVFGGS